MNTITGRITINEDVMMGKPTIRGMRITVEQILKALAAGVPPDDLEAEDFQAAAAYDVNLVDDLLL